MREKWPREPRRYRWIVDGHNAIFSHPKLEALQTGEHKAEARRRLEEMLDRFAADKGLEVLVVYDGNRMERNPDARRGGRVHTVYSLPPDEEADDRIILVVEGWVRQGAKAVVISSDRATLGARLPSGVMQVEPGELFRRLRGGVQTPPPGPPSGDFSDIEAHFLSLDPAERSARRDPAREDTPPVPPPHRDPPVPGGPPGARGSSTPQGTAGRDTRVLEAKRARGKRRQARRLSQIREGRRRRTR